VTKLGEKPTPLQRLAQWFPTGVLGLLGVRNKIFGSPKCDFRGWELVCS